MYEEALKVGNTQDIITALSGMAKVVVNDGYVEVSTDTSEIDTLREEMQREREKRIFARERDNVLIRFQSKEYGLGAWHYKLATNMYGYCVGESLKSNMGGGRYSQTPPGYTLSQAIVWGCNAAKRKNVRFSFGLGRLPEELHEAVKSLVAHSR